MNQEHLQYQVTNEITIQQFAIDVKPILQSRNRKIQIRVPIRKKCELYKNDDDSNSYKADIGPGSFEYFEYFNLQ